MKILIICQYFYPEQFKVNDISFELVKQGHQVTVLTGLPNYPSGVVDGNYKSFKNRKEDINGVKVIRSWLLGRGKGKKRLALNYLSFALSSSIKAFFLKKDFDFILVYQLSPVTMAIPGILLKKLTKKPLYIYSFDLWPESMVSGGISPGSKIYSALLKLSKWIYKSADKILISSKMFEEYFKHTLDVQRECTHLPIYAEEEFSHIQKEKNDKEFVNLMFAGNIGEMQSVETIIHAADILKDEPLIKFHIVGDGSSREKCENLTKQLKLSNVTFYGHHPITDMPGFYGMADAFLVTLKSNKVISYTLPGKVQSYMAAGKPIIGAIDGETNIVIKEAQCGICGQAEDYRELAKNIKTFLRTKDQHATYGENGKRYYMSNFSKPIFFERLNNSLRK
ncbi:glycosyltransferase [Neobacillus terrae]|uniref:glycosyltransferase n=1 Tax=Neobacillus terrae TaxID=3034837 RepID=UPI00140A3752|nr:glycosyltransferase family 4 protein [Neobacillus terrae]